MLSHGMVRPRNAEDPQLRAGEKYSWATNFPLATSTWPNTRDYLARSLGDLPEDTQRRILFENAAKLYSVEI